MFTSHLGEFTKTAANALARHAAAVIAAVTLVALAAAVGVSVGPNADASPAVGFTQSARTGADPAVATASLPDHAVVESLSLTDEPDMTGASIGIYVP